MKRDMNLVASILSCVEQHDVTDNDRIRTIYMSQAVNYYPNSPKLEQDQLDDELICKHVSLLVESGYLERQSPSLTWLGHEFIDSLKKI